MQLECHTGGGLTVLRNDTVMNSTELRQPSHPIEPLFVQRWSSRAFSREPMPMHDVLWVLEAARWATSAYNAQPWRFSATVRGDAHWERTLSVLVAANRSWARDAGALVGVFLAGYGLSRALVETVRQPDAFFQGPGNHLGYALQFSADTGLTQGQILSIPMVLIGAFLILRGRRAA